MRVIQMFFAVWLGLVSGGVLADVQDLIVAQLPPILVDGTEIDVYCVDPKASTPLSNNHFSLAVNPHGAPAQVERVSPDGSVERLGLAEATTKWLRIEGIGATTRVRIRVLHPEQGVTYRLQGVAPGTLISARRNAGDLTVKAADAAQCLRAMAPMAELRASLQGTPLGLLAEGRLQSVMWKLRGLPTEAQRADAVAKALKEMNSVLRTGVGGRTASESTALLMGSVDGAQALLAQIGVPAAAQLPVRLQTAVAALGAVRMRTTGAADFMVAAASRAGLPPVNPTAVAIAFWEKSYQETLELLNTKGDLAVNVYQQVKKTTAMLDALDSSALSGILLPRPAEAKALPVLGPVLQTFQADSAMGMLFGTADTVTAHESKVGIFNESRSWFEFGFDPRQSKVVATMVAEKHPGAAIRSMFGRILLNAPSDARPAWLTPMHPHSVLEVDVKMGVSSIRVAVVNPDVAAASVANADVLVVSSESSIAVWILRAAEARFKAYAP